MQLSDSFMDSTSPPAIVLDRGGHDFALIQGASPMVVSWGYFLDAKNHKIPTFSRKIRGLAFSQFGGEGEIRTSVSHSAEVFHSGYGQKRSVGPTKLATIQRDT